MKSYVIATIRSCNIKNANEFKGKNTNIKTYIITDKEDLKFGLLNKIGPEFIFFPHWSWVIPRDIYKNFECIVFHMTDVPFGRGGSPLQNLIVRGFNKTKISALNVSEEIDAGPVYLKRDLLLDGSAEEIFERTSNIIFSDMIPYIIKKRPAPLPQKGKGVEFKRRKPEESLIPWEINMAGIYDFIRMLDADGYPHAYIETDKLKLEFSKAIKKDNLVEAHVFIKRKKN